VACRIEAPSKENENVRVILRVAIKIGCIARYGPDRPRKIPRTPDDAGTTLLCDPEHHSCDFNLADITEVWRRGSVIASWLLDLSATARMHDPALVKFAGGVSDSGKDAGR
jgi:hypothetical protein